jgi:lysophospholipase L1-like esterase
MNHRPGMLWAFALLIVPGFAGSSAKADDQVSPVSVADWHLLEPVWSAPVIHGESTVLFRETDDGPLVGRLAFPAEEILLVRHANREKTYSAADGLRVDLKTGRVELPASSGAPFIKTADLFPPTGSPASYKHRVGHPDQSLLYGPGRWFHDRQVEITYRPHRGEWKSALPVFDEVTLPRTIARLKAGDPITLGVSGDSISAGGDASGLNDAPPCQPPFVDLVAAQLRASYKSPLTLKNRAVGGWSIANGLADLDKLLAEKPHLIIMAYGMNDVGRRDPAWFRDRAREFVERVRTADRSIELILVTPMLGHAEWVHTPREMFDKYRDELKALSGPGIAFVDVGAVWAELLVRKHDLDLTGNGLNHPNDFGHRLYAQSILSVLVGK